MDTPAEVTNLKFAVDSDEEIFWLDISMDYVLRVEIDEGIGHLININGAPTFGKAAILRELLIHLTFSSELEHEEDAVLVVKVTVETKDVRVPEVLLNFDFASDLFLDPRFDNFLFVEAFEGKNIMGFDLRPNHIDVTEPAFSERTTDVEIVQMPVARWAFPVKLMRVRSAET